MSGDRCQGQANWSQTSPSAPGDLREPWGNFENYRERNWDYPEQNWAFVNKQICACLRILFMSTALTTKWKWWIVYTNTGKSLASILLGKGFLVKKDIQYKPCCEKSQSVNKQTDHLRCILQPADVHYVFSTIMDINNEADGKLGCIFSYRNSFGH